MEPELPVETPGPQSLRPIVPALLVAIITGSVAGLYVGGMNENLAAGLAAAAAATGIALVTVTALIILALDRLAFRFLPVVSIVICVAGSAGILWMFYLPLGFPATVILAGGYIAAFMAKDASTPCPWGVGIGSTIAMCFGAAAIVWEFWFWSHGEIAFWYGQSSSVDAVRFTLIAGIIPSVIAAANGGLAAWACRRWPHNTEPE